MSATKEVSLAELVEQAIEKLGPVRRRVSKLRMRSEAYREHVYAEVAAKLAEDTSCPCCTVFAAQSFSATGRFAIDIDKIDQILALIVKYLPAILELVLKFVSIAILFLSLAVLGGSSQAQCYVDAFGNRICERPLMNRNDAPLIAPVVNALQVALPPYVPVIRDVDPIRLGCRDQVQCESCVVSDLATTFPSQSETVYSFSESSYGISRSRVFQGRPLRRFAGRVFSLFSCR